MSPIITFEKDFKNNKIVVTTEFNTPLAIIWDAFTNPAITDKWWAPKPYKTITKEMNFKEGGRWLYYMLSPEGQKHWCIAEFLKIQPKKYYEVLDAFCDENAVINTELPRMKWSNSFSEEGNKTRVVNTILGDEDELRKIIEMGFEEGYKMGLSQLYELLESAK